MPETLSRTSSGNAPTALATTGTPAEYASNTLLGAPSYDRDGSRSARARTSSLAISAAGTSPTYSTLAGAVRRSVSTSGRPPATTSRADVVRHASISVAIPFSDEIRPANKKNSPGPLRRGAAGAKFGFKKRRSAEKPACMYFARTKRLTGKYRSTRSRNVRKTRWKAREVARTPLPRAEPR